MIAALGVLLFASAAPLVWECHDRKSLKPMNAIKDYDLKVVGPNGISDCQARCDNVSQCSTILWHKNDLHCHALVNSTPASSGNITHDAFMDGLSDACDHVACIKVDGPLPPPPPLPDSTLVTTPSGRLQGFISTVHANMRAFRGIPYAKPPVGDMRWRPPQPFGKWEGTRDATSFGSTCSQSNDGASWATVEGVSKTSEDCLFLNIVAPATPDNDRRFPVVVYLHAGQFQYGAASDCESDWPFAEDIVLVAPNSRLGPFGYLGSEYLRRRSEDGSTGSYGLADQRLALEWVRDNIDAFGGNASNVVLMGESSGGTSVAAHLVMPASWGLFHRAVLESPGLTQVKTPADAAANYRYYRDSLLAARSPGCRRAAASAYDAFSAASMPLALLKSNASWTYADAAATCDNLMTCVGFTIHNTSASRQVTLHGSPLLVGQAFLPAGTNLTSYLKAAAEPLGTADDQCLLQASTARLLSLSEAVPRGDSFETDAWAPVIDGVALGGSIVDLIAAGKVAPGVDILAGSNMDEGTIFMYLTPKINCFANASQLSAWAQSFYGLELGARIPDLYSEVRQPVPLCSPPPPPGVSNHNWAAAMRSAGDYAITCRVRALATTVFQSNRSVFTYYFTHTPRFSENYGGIERLGAFHGAEVPFVFGVPEELTTPAERTLSRALGCYWRNFVHTADPNTPPPSSEPISAPCAHQPFAWPPFEAGPNEATMVLDTVGFAPTFGLKQEICDAFAGGGLL